MRRDAAGPVEAVLVLGTEGAPERRRRGGRRAQPIEEGEPEPVPTSRATVVRPEPFGSREEAAAWLAALGGDDDAVDAELHAALGTLNRALRARRAATADPYLREVATAHALVTRVGYGRGEAVAEGRFGEALELRATGSRRRRSMEAPDERFAALVGGREATLVGEELVLRARSDLNAGRPREAALQARVALEALIAELDHPAGRLSEQRATVAEAANAALRGQLTEQSVAELDAAVAAMERALARHRLGG